jgi:hypothetical protein
MLLTRAMLVKLLQQMEDNPGAVATTADEILSLIEQPDDSLSDAFPTEDQLTHRRSKFLNKIVAYIDPAKRVKTGGGWTPATWDDVHELDALCTELRDLRYERDGDADATITWRMVTRVEGSMHHFFEPYSPDMAARKTGGTVTEEDEAKYREEIMRMCSSMISTAGHRLDVLAATSSYGRKADAEQREAEDALVAFKAIIPHVDFETAKGLFADFTKKYKRSSDVARDARKALADSIISKTEVVAALVDQQLDAGEMESAEASILGAMNLWFSGALEAQRNRYNGMMRKLREKRKAETGRAWGDYIDPFRVEV